MLIEIDAIWLPMRQKKITNNTTLQCLFNFQALFLKAFLF